MADSILETTKKILGLGQDYTAFDVDIITHINSTFSTLQQLGLGPENGFMIEDSTATWDEFVGDDPRINAVKTYMYLHVRAWFDPPVTSFHLTALKEQIQELEWRLNVHREYQMNIDPDEEPDGGVPDDDLDGGSPFSAGEGPELDGGAP